MHRTPRVVSLAVLVATHLLPACDPEVVVGDVGVQADARGSADVGAPLDGGAEAADASHDAARPDAAIPLTEAVVLDVPGERVTGMAIAGEELFVETSRFVAPPATFTTGIARRVDLRDLRVTQGAPSGSSSQPAAHNGELVSFSTPSAGGCTGGYCATDFPFTRTRQLTELGTNRPISATPVVVGASFIYGEEIAGDGLDRTQIVSRSSFSTGGAGTPLLPNTLPTMRAVCGIGVVGARILVLSDDRSFGTWNCRDLTLHSFALDGTDLRSIALPSLSGILLNGDRVVFSERGVFAIEQLNTTPLVGGRNLSTLIRIDPASGSLTRVRETEGWMSLGDVAGNDVLLWDAPWVPGEGAMLRAADEQMLLRVDIATGAVRPLYGPTAFPRASIKPTVSPTGVLVHEGAAYVALDDEVRRIPL